jgi:hypothetical protein
MVTTFGVGRKRRASVAAPSSYRSQRLTRSNSIVGRRRRLSSQTAGGRNPSSDFATIYFFIRPKVRPTRRTVSARGWSMVREHRRRSRHLPPLQGVGHRAGQEIRMGYRPRGRGSPDHPRTARYRHPGPCRVRMRRRSNRQRHRYDAPERRSLHAIPRSGEGRRRRPQATPDRWQRGLDHEPAGSYSHVASDWFCKKDIEPCKKFGKS